MSMRSGLSAGLWLGAWLGAAAIGAACGSAGSAEDGACPVGSLECSCTAGGACDPGLLCIDDRCINAGVGTGDDDPGTTRGTTDSAGTMGGTTGGTTTVDPETTAGGMSSSEGGGLILDVGSAETGVIPVRGCQAIDLLFAIDGSASMAQERSALAAAASFTQVINTLEGLNGGIDYRVGVTDDDDHGFLVPAGWGMPDPWFDSLSFTPAEIATHFNGAVAQVGAQGGAALGCEHVLSSGVGLIEGDVSGFLRDDALLVLVLLTDVDDFGAYDQQGGNTCGIGCATPPPALGGLYDALVAAKNDAPEGVATIVVAGDPNVAAGFNFCSQPGSCGCNGFDCAIFHGTRLYEFADLLGANGYAADLCAGPMSVPTAVETALTESIEIACQNYGPQG